MSPGMTKNMIRKRKSVAQKLLLAWMFVCLVPTVSSAKDLYVSGHREVQVRTGPGAEHKAFTTLQTGQSMQRVHREGDYYLVKIPDGRRGYVLRQHLTEKAPSEFRLRELEAQVKQQAQEIKRLGQENSQLTEASSTHTERESGVRAELARLQDELAQRENEKNLQWFLSGAGMLLIGWIISRIPFRRQKSRQQGLSF